jgi:hypothetical protein
VGDEETDMTTLAATRNISSGYYLSLAAWDFTHVRRGDTLPAGSWLRLPVPVVLALAPALGLLMVIFLPFIGFALTLGLVARKAAESLQQAFYAIAAVVQPSMRPGEAYLTGKREAEASTRRDENAMLDALEREIANRRAQTGAR